MASDERAIAGGEHVAAAAGAAAGGGGSEAAAPKELGFDEATAYAAASPLPAPLPLVATVIHGFKRGSKELGVPTANLDVEELGGAIDGLAPGIYYGWASLRESATTPVAPAADAAAAGADAAEPRLKYSMVMSVGWNPFYKNEKKTVEAHLLFHSFPRDFYGERLAVLAVGYLRPELNFPSVDALIHAIRTDIAMASRKLSEADAALLRHPVLSSGELPRADGGAGAGAK